MMAKITVEKIGNNGVYVDFGDYAAILPSPQGFNSNCITNIYPDGDGIKVIVEGRNAQIWLVSHTEIEGYLKVDTIDGIAPVDRADLIKKITELL